MTRLTQCSHIGDRQWWGFGSVVEISYQLLACGLKFRPTSNFSRLLQGYGLLNGFTLVRSRKCTPQISTIFRQKKLFFIVHRVGSMYILKDWGAKVIADLFPKHSVFFWDTLDVNYFGPCCSLTYVLFLLMLTEGSKVLCNPQLCTIVYPGSIPKT